MTTPSPFKRPSIDSLNWVDSFDQSELKRASAAAFADPSVSNEMAVVSAALSLVRDLRLAEVPPEQMLIVIKRATALEGVSGRHEDKASRKWDQLVERVLKACIAQYYTSDSA